MSGSVNNIEAPPEIVPVNNGTGSTQRKFMGILDALSQIQQYYVIEQAGQEIPENHMTISGKLNFFKIGIGSGIFEGIVFTIVTTILLPIVADPYVSKAVSAYFPLAQYKLFLMSFNCLPILLIGGICVFVSQYRIGVITKKAVDALLIGRVLSLVVKGIAIFCLFIFISEWIDQKSAWSAANVLSYTGIETRVAYRIIWNLRPFLIKTAFDVLFIFTISAFIPFVTTWAFAIWRGYKAWKLERFWNK